MVLVTTETTRGNPAAKCQESFHGAVVGDYRNPGCRGGAIACTPVFNLAVSVVVNTETGRSGHRHVDAPGFKEPRLLVELQWFPDAVLTNLVFAGLYDSRPGRPANERCGDRGPERRCRGVRLATDERFDCALVGLGIRS